MLLVFSLLLALVLLPLKSTAVAPLAVGVVLVCLAASHAGRFAGARWKFVWTNSLGGAVAELLVGFVTAPGATNTNLTMSTGDSLNVRATAQPLTIVRLAAAWTQHQVAGTLRVKSPKMHDQNQGLRLKSIVAEIQPLWRLGVYERLYQTDALVVDLTGSAVGGQIESAALLLDYDDVSGLQGSYIDVPTLLKRGVHEVAIESSIALGAGGGWKGGQALNATFDPWKANTQYALIGYQVDTKCVAVAWRGIDTGNVRFGGPGNSTFKELTGNWFMRLSEEYGLPRIPVFNSNNRANVTIDAAGDQTAPTVVVNSIFVELAPQ